MEQTPEPAAVSQTEKAPRKKTARSKTEASPVRPGELPPRLSRPSGSDFPQYKPARLYLPEKVIPDRQWLHILDQGQEGSGVGFAIAALINYLTARAGRRYAASPRMLHEVSKTYSGIYNKNNITQDLGSMISAGLYGWSVFGAATEDAWPYSPGQIDRTMTEERIRSAAQLKPRSIESVPKDRDTVEAAIVERGAVVCGASIHNGWMQAPSLQSSVIPYEPNASTLGGHAFPIIGYTGQGFIVQLSWGVGFQLNLDGVDFPGLMLWTYPDFEANYSEGYVVTLPDEYAGVEQRHLRAGFFSDLSFTDDHLNIMPDVRAICALLSARDVQPPLALGIFGNWGTGKSFFMEKMREEIQRLTRLAADNPGKTPYYEKIVQIEFNAWHYLDTNLWASLVSEIFDRLHEQIVTKVTGEDERKELLKQLGDAQGLYRQSKLEFDDAQREKQAAVQSLEQVRQEQQRYKTLQQIQHNTSVAADVFHLPEAKTTVEAAVSLANTLGETRTRAQKLWRAVWQSENRGQVLAWLAFLLLGPLAVWLAATYLLPAFPALRDLVRWGGAAAGMLVSIFQGLAPKVRKINEGITALDDLAQQVQAVPEAQETPVDELVHEEEAKVQERKEREAQATAAVNQAAQRVAELEGKLAELDPRWKMQNFILERSGSEDYSKQLGLISLIRHDFDRLSLMLRELDAISDAPPRAAETESAAPEGRGNQKQRTATQSVASAATEGQSSRPVPPLPFQRIILYIDDLDRCKADRVVEVLEAVHLLLAFPLFIVVVAVDPRWLRTCLEIHYPDLLMVERRRAMDEDGLDQPATPQDYLEKIFQIPFYLRPISDASYKSLIQGLVQPEIEVGETLNVSVTVKGGQVRPAAGPSIQAQDAKPAGEEGRANSGTPGEAIPTEPNPEKPLTPSELNPQRMKFNREELDDLMHYSPLFRAPRAVKRFINTYRLIRIGLEQSEPTDRTALRIVMALLAVVAGYPNTAPRFLRMLLDQMRSTTPAPTWEAFLEDARNRPPAFTNTRQTQREDASRQNEAVRQIGAAQTGASVSQSANSGEGQPLPDGAPGAGNGQSAQPPSHGNGSSGASAAAPGPAGESTESDDVSLLALQQEWRQLCGALSTISRDGFLPPDLTLYYDLIPLAARFSFSVSDLPGTRKA